MISPETPINERSICSFDYRLNYDSKRVPSTLIEAVCNEKNPSLTILGNRILESQPLHYKIRVLKFDDECQTFRETEATIALACLPVVQARARNENGENFAMNPIKAGVVV